MPNKFTFLSAVLLLLTFAACKKSNNSGGNTGSNVLTGNWNFVSLNANANISVTETLGPLTTRVIDLVDFRTIDNVGTITFTADSMAAKGVGYNIDTTYTSYTYIGPVGDTTTVPLVTTIPPASNTESYALVGTDSISFPGGAPFAVGLNTGETVQINGAHYTISGTTLTLTSTVDQTGNISYNGIPVPGTTQVQSTIVLTRQ